MSNVVRINRATWHEIDLSSRDLRAHTIMSLPEDDRDDTIERLKHMRNRPSWQCFFIFRPILNLCDDSFRRSIDHRSQAAFDSTIEKVIEEVIKNDHCEVRASAHNPDNYSAFDAMLVPEPSQITVECDAKNCCRWGIERVSEAISSELNVSRAKFDALIEG